jgi:hypothetical protein
MVVNEALRDTDARSPCQESLASSDTNGCLQYSLSSRIFIRGGLACLQFISHTRGNMTRRYTPAVCGERRKPDPFPLLLSHL